MNFQKGTMRKYIMGILAVIMLCFRIEKGVTTTLVEAPQVVRDFQGNWIENRLFERYEKPNFPLEGLESEILVP